MHKSITRRAFIGRLGTAGALAGGLVAPSTLRARATFRDEGFHDGELDDWSDTDYGDYAGFSEPANNPDPEHVLQRSRGWKVLPNGVDDHDNLEWALRNTTHRGVVKLVAGTYKIGTPVVVPDFDGTLAGSGAARTTLTCTDEFSYALWEESGGDENNRPPDFPRVSVDRSSTLTTPTLFSFYKTPLKPGEHPKDRANRIVIRDLRFHGVMRGSPWLAGDQALCMIIVNSFDWNNPEAELETTRQDVVVTRVKVDGYGTPAFGPFENACSCITVFGGPVLTPDYNLRGSIDGDAIGFENGGLLGVTPAPGNVTFNSCTLRNCRFGPGVVGYRDGTIAFLNNRTDGCRGNCLQIIDNSNVRVIVRNNDLFCNSFLLPPWLASGGASNTEPTDVPSSLGCVVAIQGLGAAIGYIENVQFPVLAWSEEARVGLDPALTGPLGTWRPQGPATAPRSSQFWIFDNACESSETINTYCVHLVDAANLAFGSSTLHATVWENDCTGSETCISLEHVTRGRVIQNECSSQAFGLELYNAQRTKILGNSFNFTQGDGCEIHELTLGEKIDFSRVVPGAGVCLLQR